MKKTKLLIGTLALATMFMGTGYAYWNETVTVTQTVNTSELDVDITSATLQVPQETEGHALGEVSSLTCTNDKDNASTVEFTIDKIYTGSYAQVNITFQNMGPLAVKLAGFKITANPDEGEEFIKKLLYSLDGTNYMSYDSIQTNWESQIDNINNINNANARTCLIQDGKLNLTLCIKVPDTYTNTSKQKGELKLEFDWEQFNK